MSGAFRPVTPIEGKADSFIIVVFTLDVFPDGVDAVCSDVEEELT